MIRICYSIVTKLEEGTFQGYLKCMPDDIQNRIKGFQRWQDAHACLIGRLLLMEGLKHYGFNTATLKEVKYNRYSRPYIDGNIDFNISHSGSIVICGISDRSRIGIDVELINPINIKDFRSQFNPEEWSEIIEGQDVYKAFYTVRGIGTLL